MTATARHRAVRRPRRPSRSSVLSVAGLVALTCAGSLAGWTPAATAVPAAGVSYTYDAEGRLATVADGTGQLATYRYDRAGNVLSVTRSVAPARPAATAAGARPAGTAPAVSAVSPAHVGVGAQITISGRGFDPTPAANIVHVGDLLAPVTSAASHTLVVTAPPGAGGQVSVRTAHGTATGPTVVVSGAPTASAYAAPVAVLPTTPGARQAAPGVTALSGRVLDSAGRPLPGVVVTVSTGWSAVGTHATTDDHGWFLATNLSAGLRQLTVDGTAVPGGPDYGTYVEPVSLASGVTSVLPWTTYLTPIDHAHDVDLTSPLARDVVVTNPALPGLELRLPAGAVVRDAAGRPVRRISLTPLDPARTPTPLRPGSIAPYFSLQPSGATISGGGAELRYPNTTGKAAGQRVTYLIQSADWSSDTGSGYRRGTATISPDGRQVIPDPDTRLTIVMPNSYVLVNAPGKGPAAGSGCQCGDPVDVGTGLFVDTRTDLMEDGAGGTEVTRVYRQSDNVIRNFGIGGSDAYNLYIASDVTSGFDLVLPDGGRVVYRPTGQNSIFAPINTPTAFAGSSLAQNGAAGSVITLRDGSTLRFGDPDYLTGFSDRYGNSTTINRHDEGPQNTGDITTVTTSAGHWQRYTYAPCRQTDQALCVSAVTDDAGRTVRYAYDKYARLRTVTDAAGRVTTNTWAACTSDLTCTELLSTTDPMGHVTSVTYGSTGTVATQTQADGGVWKYKYTMKNGAISSAVVTDPDGVQSTITINSKGYSSGSVLAPGTAGSQTTARTFAPNSNLVASETDALGNVTRYAYNAKGLTTSVIQLASSAHPVTTTLTYDSFSRVTSVTDAAGAVTRVVWDDKRRTVTTTDATGRTRKVRLDRGGRPVSAVDALGNTSYYSWIGDDLVAYAAPDGGVTSYFTDAAGNLVESTAPDGSTLDYTYDAVGNQLTAASALGPVATMTWDADDRLVSLADGAGNTTRYAYDAMDDITSRTDPLGHTATTVFDRAGRVTATTDRVGNRTTYSYNAVGRVSQVNYGVTATAAARTVGLSYDALNRLTGIADSVSGSYSYSYDGLGNRTASTSPTGNIAYSYDAASRPSTVSVEGGTPIAYAYDPAGRLTTVTRGAATASLTYDAVGRLATTTSPNGMVATDTYDAASRVTRLAYRLGGSDLGDLRYGYDVNGRISAEGGTMSSAQLPRAVGASTYDAGNDLLTSDGTAYTYDANGSLLTDGSSTYGWDARNDLTSVIGAAGTRTLSYDPAGRLTGTTASGVTTANLYAPDGSLLRQLTGGASTDYLSLGGRHTVQVTTAAGAEYPVQDIRRSTVAVFSGTGTASSETSGFDPAGRRTTTGTTADAEGFATSTTVSDDVDQLGVRAYSPDTGRFLSQDPLGFAGGSTNLTQYAAGDPIDVVDPSGLFGLLGAAIGAVAGGVIGGGWAAGKYLFDVARGKKSFNKRDLLGKTVGGLVSGAVTGACDGFSDGVAAGACAVAGGALGAAAGDLTEGAITGDLPSGSELGADMVSGAVSGGIGIGVGKLVPDPFPINSGQFRPRKLNNVYNPGTNARRMYGNSAAGAVSGLPGDIALSPTPAC
ncbi:RHS repeat-associated core domain-containing protein [Jatrophihabitans sp. YIM 134969]